MTSVTELTFSGGTLLVRGPRAGAACKGMATVPWVWDQRVSGWRCDALHYADVRADISRRNLPIDDHVPQWRDMHWSRVSIHELRTEQRDAVEAWSKSRRGCIVMPTGTGKTEVALAIMADAAVSTLVVSPVRDLMYQWHRRILDGLAYNSGIIGDSVFRVDRVCVTTYDSACIHMDRIGDKFGLIVFDECHHLPGQVRSDAARMSAAPQRLGLTATPIRSDGRHVDLDFLIGPACYELPLSSVRGRTLADYEVIRVPIHLSADEQAQYDRLSNQVRHYMIERQKTEPGFTWEDLCAESGTTPAARRALLAYHAKKSIEDRAEEKLRVLEDLFRLHAGDPCLVFAGSNAMARDVSRRFLVPCLLNHCRKQERLDVLKGLESGEYPALVANQVLDEGVDLPQVKVAIVIGGLASSRQAKQRLGRILRKSGNARAVLYEIVTAGTNEVRRSRSRRATDAYEGTRHRRL